MLFYSSASNIMPNLHSLSSMTNLPWLFLRKYAINKPLVNASNLFLTDCVGNQEYIRINFDLNFSDRTFLSFFSNLDD